MSDWWDDLSARWYPKDRRPPRPAKQASLAAKRDAVLRLNPRSICEIGVRAGYSAYAMLTAAPSARFVGIDLGTREYGNPAPLREHARCLLSGFQNVALLYEDSHAMEKIDPPVDLIHIDGDHGEDGCYADLELSLRSGAKWVVLDDAMNEYYAGVGRAIRRFCRESGLVAEWIEDGHNGTAIIELGGEGGP